MSPGSRPSQPLPKPDHNNAPTAANSRPVITRNLPSSFIAQKMAREAHEGNEGFRTPISQIDTGYTRSVLERGDLSPL